jgi:hypothetical protein
MKWYTDTPDLDVEGFKHVGDKKIRLYKGGGGSNTTTVQQSIPEELLPYIRETIQEGQKVAALPYVPYKGTRIGQFVPEQQGVMTEVMGLRTPQQYQTAMAGAQGTGGLSYGTAQQGLGRALAYTPGTFGQREAQYYSSPYQQGVTNIALREAQRAADIERRNIGLQAVGRGTSGGSAAALQRAELARNLMTQRGDIQARGSEAAFQQAQQQFERDRAAAAQAAGLGAQVGTSGLGASLQSALGLGELAGASQKANLSRLEAQRQIGSEIQGRQQRILDQQYQDFLAQRGYPREQLAFYSDLVRGNAPLFGTIQQTTQPAPNMLSQLAGAGTALYGASRLGAFASGGSVKKDYNSGLAKLMLDKVTR